MLPVPAGVKRLLGQGEVRKRDLLTGMLVAIAVFALSKKNDDFFIQLNRDRTTLQISIFQLDYLSELAWHLHGRVKVSGHHSDLRPQIETARLSDSKENPL